MFTDIHKKVVQDAIQAAVKDLIKIREKATIAEAKLMMLYTHSFLLLTTMTSFTFRGPLVILQVSLPLSTGPWVRIFSRGMFSCSISLQPIGWSLRHLTDIVSFVHWFGNTFSKIKNITRVH